MDKESIEVYARAIAMAITTAISIAALLGYNAPVIEEHTIVAVVVAVLTVIVNIVNHWKNNDYTIEAKTGTRIMRDMKANRNNAGSPYSDGGDFNG